jgi:gamma-glutamylcyclotransferase
MTTVCCVAYGSNLHPVRMSERVPSSRAVGVVELAGYRLVFHKRSNDGSGKAMLETASNALAYGVLYEFDLAEKAGLDRLEGSGYGYTEQQLRVSLSGKEHSAFVYMAASSYVDGSLRPYHWYKHLVLAGATYHCMPAEYIATLMSVPSVEDPDEKRRTRNEDLLQRVGWRKE